MSSVSLDPSSNTPVTPRNIVVSPNSIGLTMAGSIVVETTAAPTVIGTTDANRYVADDATIDTATDTVIGITDTCRYIADDATVTTVASVTIDKYNSLAVPIVPTVHAPSLPDNSLLMPSVVNTTLSQSLDHQLLTPAVVLGSQTELSVEETGDVDSPAIFLIGSNYYTLS